MSGAVIVIGFIFGTIIGSFLNVVILRAHTNRSLNGHSHCMSCGERLKAHDLIPLLSYLVLLGRCRYCGARVSPRYPIVEGMTGVLFALIFSQALDPITTLFTLLFLSILLVIFVYDLEHLIIPDEYVIALIPLALALVSWNGAMFTVPEWNHLVAPALTFGFLGGLWKISGGKWIGLGDAKLSVPLALVVGLNASFSLIVYAFWIGAVVSVSLLGLERIFSRGKQHLRFFGIPLTMKAEVPFAPFLIGSFLLVFYAHADVFTLTDYVIEILTSS